MAGAPSQQPPGAPPRAADDAPALPALARLEGVLASTHDVEALARLRSFAAAHEDVARHCRLAYAEFARLAVFRLRVERKLGATLMQVVRHGGHRPRSTRETSPGGGRLPAGVTKQMAARYRQLARIAEGVFEAYLERARAAGQPPSANGARAFAAAADGRSRTPRQGRSPAPAALPAAVLETVQRFLGAIDVQVGTAELGLRAAVALPRVQPGKLRGRVLVAECTEPGFWLPRLARCQRAGACTELVALLPAATGAPWFRHVGDSDWLLCLVSGAPALLVAYHGPRRHLFALAFRPLGAVLRPADR
jgi:hypothetical protein